MVRALHGLVRRRRLVLVIAAAAVLILTVHWTIGLFSTSADTPVICEQDAAAKREMRIIFLRSVKSLQTLKLQPFLCYDSLWSALDSQQSFAWKSYNEICVRNEDVSRTEEATLIRTFQREGLKLQYSSSIGEYEVSEAPNGLMRLKIVLFEKDAVTGNMRRVGWKHRLIPPDSCALIHCFPPILLQPPLPVKQLYGIPVPVPRDEIEIQKYHYPDDWWKSSRAPKECTLQPQSD